MSRPPSRSPSTSPRNGGMSTSTSSLECSSTAPSGRRRTFAGRATDSPACPATAPWSASPAICR
ncbi:unnamed protein product [Heligmosomoides polygyrus]|uniref:Uncharacterized protein n=1 Tax=Heligmosomoides polygyrus TaxID=6339 RepID=A0A3P8ELB0_HELPZ|nr:unnamed protein product [Heligmosomoides polygyrus]